MKQITRLNDDVTGYYQLSKRRELNIFMARIEIKFVRLRNEFELFN